MTEFFWWGGGGGAFNEICSTINCYFVIGLIQKYILNGITTLQQAELCSKHS